MTRPISTKAIARSKLFAAIKAVLATTAVLTGGWCIFWLLAESGMHHAFREFRIIGEGLSLIGIITMGAFAAITVGVPLLVSSVAAYFVSLPPLALILYGQERLFGLDESLLVRECYTIVLLALLIINLIALRRRWAVRSYLPWLSLAAVGAFLAPYAVYAHYGHDFLETPLPILFPALLGVVLYAEAHRRGLLTAHNLVVAGLSFLIVSAAVLWYINRGMTRATPVPYEEELMAAALIAAMWTSAAWLPIAVQWQRHR